jgi:hypothetical protein
VSVLVSELSGIGIGFVGVGNYRGVGTSRVGAISSFSVPFALDG